MTMEMIASRLSHVLSSYIHTLPLVPWSLRKVRIRMAHASQRCIASSMASRSSDNSKTPITSSLSDMVVHGGGSLSPLITISPSGLHGLHGVHGVHGVHGMHGGLGLRAKGDLSSGELLVFLPESSTLTYDNHKTDQRLRRLIGLVPEELWGVKVALALLAERVKGPQSTFNPYISNLPIGFSGFPMFFSREAVGQIEYPPVVAQVKKRGVFLHEFTSKQLACLSAAEDPFNGIQVDINALGWALAAVSSRAFRTRGPGHPASLLPLIDLANHSFDPCAEVKVEERGGVKGISLVAKRVIKKDEEITLSYGPLTNDFLLLDYGFIVPSNPYDQVQLRWSQGLVTTGAMIAGLEMKDDPLATWQQSLLEELNLEGPSPNTEVFMGGDVNGGVDPRLIAGARIVMAGEENALEGRDVKSLGILKEPLGIKTEARLLRALSGMAALTLSHFSTTLREDEEALVQGICPRPVQHVPPTPAPRDGSSAASQSPPSTWLQLQLTDETRIAIRFRAEKKRILSRAIQVLGSHMDKMSKADREEKKPATVTNS